MTTWFTSDTHFWHKAIIGFCQRPVPEMLHPRRPPALQDTKCLEVNVQKMNSWLIERWNARVKPEDEVWHLGDFAFCGKEKGVAIISQLNGRIKWVPGNHDYGLAKQLRTHPLTVNKLEIKNSYHNMHVELKYEDDEGEERTYKQQIILCHFPILSWDGMAHGSWMLHGHCHGSIDRTWNSTGLRMDMGVDAEGNNWAPVSLEEVQQRMALRTVVPVDHHQ